jgi:hypothetical protein
MKLEGVSFEGRWNINVFMYQDGYRVVDIIDSIWKHSEYEIIIMSCASVAMWQSKREISRECNDKIGSAKGSQISEKY